MPLSWLDDPIYRDAEHKHPNGCIVAAESESGIRIRFNYKELYLTVPYKAILRSIVVRHPPLLDFTRI
jgi:hypothetical protein